MSYKPKREDPIIDRFKIYLFYITSEHWIVIGRDVRWRNQATDIDYLLLGMRSGKLLWVEITELHRTFERYPFIRLEKHFRQYLCDDLRKLAFGKYDFLKVEAEDVETVEAGYSRKNQPSALLDLTVRKGNVFPAFGESSELPDVVFGPGIFTFGLGSRYDINEMVRKEVRERLNKKVKKFSDQPGHKVIILVDEHPYARPVNVRTALKKLDEEGILTNLNAIYFLPNENNPRKIDENNEGLFTKVFDKPELVYPSLN